MKIYRGFALCFVFKKDHNPPILVKQERLILDFGQSQYP